MKISGNIRLNLYLKSKMKFRGSQKNRKALLLKSRILQQKQIA